MINSLLFILLTLLPKQSSWVNLSSDKISDNWHTYLSESVEGWESNDGVYILNPSDEKNNGLVSNKDYHSFILSVEWKVDKGGNSGVFWALKEDPKYSVPYLTAPEVQVIDDDFYDETVIENHNHMNGSVYDMVTPSSLAANPTGEWNQYIIEINYKKNIGKVNLNGVDVSSFPLKGKAWEKMVKNSKFNTWEGFAKTEKGPIAFQDHGTKVYYRNIKIKEL
tara:strand:- start:4706 stop:5371 length:666 start_codon:yes stop_codon:yes gene_type:complete